MKIILTKPENAEQLLQAIISNPEHILEAVGKYPELFKECIHLHHAYILRHVDASYELVETFCNHTDEILKCEKTLKTFKMENRLISMKIKRSSNISASDNGAALAKRTLENLIKEKEKLDEIVAKVNNRRKLFLMPLQILFS